MKIYVSVFKMLKIFLEMSYQTALNYLFLISKQTQLNLSRGEVKLCLTLKIPNLPLNFPSSVLNYYYNLLYSDKNHALKFFFFFLLSVWLQFYLS